VLLPDSNDWNLIHNSSNIGSQRKFFINITVFTHVNRNVADATEVMLI
jgi:hypothetical protein